MSLTVLDATLSRLVQEDLLDRELTISWHGAEPLMAGLDWYRPAFDLVARKLLLHRVVHVFQTNGVLIDDAWCDFFIEHGAHVGVSLDGIGALAAPRVNWAGRPAEPGVRRGMDRLNERGLAWTLLAVVTAETMAQPGAFVDFVRGTGCRHLGFKVEESNVAHTSSLVDRERVEQMYAHFLQDVWSAFPEAGPITVREFDVYRRARRRRRGRAVAVTVTPLRNLTVGVDGNFTIFSGELLFGGDPRFVFGNVMDGPLLDCLSSDRFAQVSAEILEGVRTCARECDLYAHCGSFFISQKLAEAGTFAVGETLACRLEMKTTFVALDEVSGLGQGRSI